jgi:hypothetical protein
MIRPYDVEDEELLLPASRASFPAAWYTCLCILFLLGALSLAYCIYALASANSTVDACGKGLWYFVMVRFVVGFYASIILMQAKADFDHAVRWFISALHLVSLVMGSMQTHAAMKDGACVAAMSAASYTGTPLLAIVSVFFLVDDGVNALSTLCVFFTSGFRHVSAR